MKNYYSYLCLYAYRVEVDAGGNTRIDQARVGAFNNVQYRVWAEFDISPLSGKEIANIGCESI